MDLFLMVFAAAIVVLAAIGLLADRQARRGDKRVTPGLSLLPGDIKYESPNGNVRIYFPIATSIVLSIVLSTVLWLFS